MISFVRVKGFKSFKDNCVEPRLLNILAGLNGSGKSSFMQSLLLVGSIGADIQSVRPQVRLNTEILTLGTQKDVFYNYRSSNSDIISIEIKRGGAEEGLCFKFKFTDDNDDFLDSDIVTSSGADPQQMQRLAFGGEIVHMKYICADRAAAVQEYPFSRERIRTRQWGTEGENAIAYLAENGSRKFVASNLVLEGSSDPSLLGQVNAWMSVFAPGIFVNAEKIEAMNRSMLSFGFMRGVGQAKFKPQNVGFGISYVLPLIVALLSAEDNDILLIENPEAHLHPRGQAELGKLIARVASRGTQIFVETHSDHIINGIRVSVKKKEIAREDTLISFFSREKGETSEGAPEECSRIVPIKIDENGELSDYPHNFMDEWTNQLASLFE